MITNSRIIGNIKWKASHRDIIVCVQAYVSEETHEKPTRHAEI
jgi:hypothetical protein